MRKDRYFVRDISIAGALLLCLIIGCVIQTVRKPAEQGEVGSVAENPTDLDGNARELLDGENRPERKSSRQVVLDAIEEHKEKIASDPEDREVPAYQLAIANLYVTKLGDYEAASIHLEELVEEFPDSNLVSEAYAKLGNCYENLGWSSLAKATYKKMMSHFPEDSQSYAYARAKRYGDTNVR